MKSYFLTRRSQYYYSAFTLIGLIVILSAYIYFARNLICAQIYFLGIGLYAFYILFKKLKDEHLSISQEGVEYSAPGINFEVRWNDFEKISTHWRYGFHHECLLVSNAKVRVKKWRGGNFGIPAPANFWTEKTIVPLSCFAKNWRDTELGVQIKQYAPHLFEEENPHKSVKSVSEI